MLTCCLSLQELDHINDRLNQACGATAAQVELNKKRDSEVVKLRRDLEESHVQRDATVTGMKKKQSDSVAEMNEQIDQLSKMKQKVDKDKDQIVKEIHDVRGATDEVGRSKVILSVFCLFSKNPFVGIRGKTV